MFCASTGWDHLKRADFASAFAQVATVASCAVLYLGTYAFRDIILFGNYAAGSMPSASRACK